MMEPRPETECEPLITAAILNIVADVRHDPHVWHEAIEASLLKRLPALALAVREQATKDERERIFAEVAALRDSNAVDAHCYSEVVDALRASSPVPQPEDP